MMGFEEEEEDKQEEEEEAAYGDNVECSS
jgi:hypothetical protein